MSLESLTPNGRAWIEGLRKRDPELAEFAAKEFEQESARIRATAKIGISVKPLSWTRVDEVPAVATQPRRVPEAIVVAKTRPVFLIQNDRFVAHSLGPESQLWAARVEHSRAHVDRAILSVGRIDLRNHPRYDWGGTAWLVSDEILVTNRHVATLFATREGQEFIFRPGLDPNHAMSCNVDFLEEHQGPISREFPVLRVLWIAPTRGPDIAFLQVARSSNGRALPRHIELAMEDAANDSFVCTIGYPGRDPDAPDHSMVLETFGDVYEKKRLAPGQVLRIQNGDLLHDCSTLKGNSGSVVLDLKSGKAVGLHYVGEFLRANYAVPAATVKAALESVGRVSRLEVVRARPLPQPLPTKPSAPEPACNGLEWTIPIEVKIRIGKINSVVPLINAEAVTPVVSRAEQLENALAVAQAAYGRRPDVLLVRIGKRLRNQWITSEDVIVFEVLDKLPKPRLFDAGIDPLPTEVAGIAIDVRTASVQTQLRAQGIFLASRVNEAPEGINYLEPTGFQLTPVDAPMLAKFHVSPDCGFPVLQEFFSHVTERLTATMYEFDAEHVFNELLAAMDQNGRTLKMVTQPQKPDNSLSRFIRRLEDELDNFEHITAGVKAPLNLFDTSYHIKVAVADSRWLWLSSGNWKSSGQPQLNPAGTNETSWTPLETLNREWHVMIDSAELASQFERYIEHDFDLSSQPAPEAVTDPVLPDVFIPISAPLGVLERTAVFPTYFAPLEINRRLRMIPLLTPDFSVYIDAFLDLVRGAQQRVLLENQSFNLLAANNFPKFEELFTLLVEKQQAGLDVRIIFRDNAEFGSGAAQDQEVLILRLLEFGFDEDRLRIQVGCHTKGLIVDSSRVLLGSHNLTNAGTHRNRDASLIVDDPEVARYFEQIFEFDWENLAGNRIPENIGGVRVAREGEPTPPGMIRINAAELLDDDFPSPSFFAALTRRTASCVPKDNAAT